AAPRERIAETEAGKASEQAEILVERQKHHNRALPADQRQLDKQAERGRENNRCIDIANIQTVEIMSLRQTVGIDDRLEPAKHMKQPPSGQTGRATEQRAFEPKTRRSQRVDQNACRPARIVRSQPQTERKNDQENEEGTTTDGQE